jgi:hypothetical protein
MIYIFDIRYIQTIYDELKEGNAYLAERLKEAIKKYPEIKE